MRIDSCRNCGTKLEVIKTCHNCNQPQYFESKSCDSFIDEQIHNHENFASQSFLHHNGVNGN